MNTRKSALGKGLGALLDTPYTEINAKNISGEAKTMPGNIANIPISQIEVNPFQPRTEFDETALRELSESIKNQGIIQPITVRKIATDKYQIISGERRYRASKLADMETIPAYVRIANDQAMLEMALVENIQRRDLNAIEIAISYKRLIDECKLSQEEMADKVGKERSTVTNYLRLLKLPPQIQAALRDDVISMGHARALISINDPVRQLFLFKKITDENLSVREVERMAKEDINTVMGKPKPTAKINADIKHIQDKLTALYETRVELKANANGKGSIVMNFYSTDDLNRLLDMLSYE